MTDFAADTVGLALAAFSPAWDAPAWAEVEAPDVPGPEAVEPLEHDPARMPEFFVNLEPRPTFGGWIGSGGEEAVTGGWMRVRPPQVLDAPTAAFLCDAWWPAVFSRLGAPVGVPTIDLTVHFRRTLPVAGASADDFVLGTFRTRTVHDGFLEEDGELWSSGGALLAQSRQLALLRVPRA